MEMRTRRSRYCNSCFLIMFELLHCGWFHCYWFSILSKFHDYQILFYGNHIIIDSTAICFICYCIVLNGSTIQSILNCVIENLWKRILEGTGQGFPSNYLFWILIKMDMLSSSSTWYQQAMYCFKYSRN